MPKQLTNNSPKRKVNTVFTEASFYQGSLPPPEMMEKYQDIDPTFADRIVKMAEKEQAHAHFCEKRQMIIINLQVIAGMIFGIIALSTMCYLVYFAISKQNTKVAFGLVGVIIGVVGLFIYQRRRLKK